MDIHRTFHPFPNLPAELRHKIWHLAQPEPELIQGGMVDRPGPEYCLRERMDMLVLPPTVPSLFHVCVESRDICLALYTRGFHTDDNGVDDVEGPPCSNERNVTAFVKGKEVRVPRREVYWRPSIDVLHVHNWSSVYRSSDVDGAADFLSGLEAPSNGLQSYGVRRVVLHISFFEFGLWNPITCPITWGMETVYIVLKRRRRDTPEQWQAHLACFGKWWLCVNSPVWQEVVGQKAPLEDRVPFIPKAIGVFEGEELQARHFDEAIDCVLLELDEDEDEEGYAEIFQFFNEGE